MSVTKVLNSMTKKVLDAVNTVISSDVADEKLEGYRTRLANLTNEFEAVKESMKKYSKTLQALAAAGKGINDELFSFYAGSSRVQGSLPIFANAQKVIDAAVEKNMKEKMGWECLKQFDDWTEECAQMREKIKQTEDAQAEMRNVDLKLQNQRAANQKKVQRGQQLTVQDENSLKAVEDLFRKHQTSLTKRKALLDEQMNKFMTDRHTKMDSIFVRFMELQLDTTQLMQNASLAFTPIIESYRRRYPLTINNEGVVKPPVGTQISSPVHNAVNANSSPPNGSVNANSSSVASSAGSPLHESKSATGPVKKHSNAPPPKSAKVTKTKKKHDSEDEESDEDGSEEESEEESDDEYSKESLKKKVSYAPPQLKVGTPVGNAIPILDKKTPKVSTGATLTAPIASPSAVPVSAPPTVARSSTASPVPPVQPVPATTPSGSVIDFLNFGNASAASSSSAASTDLPSTKPGSVAKQSSLLDMFAGASSSSSSSSASSSSTTRSSNALDFDFGLTSPSRSASSAAASNSSSDSFDPLENFPPLRSEPNSRNNTLRPPGRSIPVSQSHDDFDPLNPNRRSKLDDIDEGPSPSSGLDSVDGGADKAQWLPGELTDDKKSMLDEKLNAWEFSNGQQKPIHTLLSTLSSVLWPNSGWNANISDLMDMNGIKKAKMKAARSIHPDKQVNASPAQQYVSKRVFAAINSAFQKYTGQGQQGMVYY